MCDNFAGSKIGHTQCARWARAMDGPCQTLHEAAKAYIEHLRTQGKTARTLYT